MGDIESNSEYTSLDDTTVLDSKINNSEESPKFEYNIMAQYNKVILTTFISKICYIYYIHKLKYKNIYYKYRLYSNIIKKIIK